MATGTAVTPSLWSRYLSLANTVIHMLDTRTMTENSSAQPFDPATAWADPPGLGRALMIGVSIGVAGSFFGVAGAFLAGGQGWGASIGMGAFVAFWGGLGFGGMLGGVVWATHAEEASERDRLEAPATALMEGAMATNPPSNSVITIGAAIADPEPTAFKVAS